MDVVLTSADNLGGAGVQKTVYSVNGGPPSDAPGNSVTLPFVQEGDYTVAYYAVDWSQNIEEARTVQVRIDKSPPVLVYQVPGVVNEGEDIPLDGIGTYDAISGLASKFWVTPEGSDFGDPTKFSAADGPSFVPVELTAVDAAGNVADSGGISVIVQNVAPTAKIVDAPTSSTEGPAST